MGETESHAWPSNRGATKRPAVGSSDEEDDEEENVRHHSPQHRQREMRNDIDHNEDDADEGGEDTQPHQLASTESSWRRNASAPFSNPMILIFFLFFSFAFLL